LLGLAVGVLGTVALAAALVGFRGEIINANAALALVLPVLAGAVIGGRWAGVATAVVAAISFDFFFTKPYGSLTIADHNDVETTIIFLIVALVAAEIGIRARTTRGQARLSKSEVDRLYRIADLGAHAGDPADLVLAVQAEMMGLFDLEDCWYEAQPSHPLPRLGAAGAIEDAPLRYAGRDFALPTGGVEVPVGAHGRSYGRLVLDARPGTNASVEQRRVAVALADELGLALASVRGTND
jgi:K+-sensing histidine kinase KdpD